MIWLQDNIDTFLDEESSAPKGCRECFIRRIAISFFKLWLNLARKRKQNFKYLIVPDDDKLVEFTCL